MTLTKRSLKVQTFFSEIISFEIISNKLSCKRLNIFFGATVTINEWFFGFVLKTLFFELFFQDG